MHNLVPAPVKMSTIELVDFINRLKPDCPPIRHTNMLRKMETFFPAGVFALFEQLPLPTTGIERKGYLLEKREIVLLAATYEYSVAAAVYDRMTALEGHLEDAANRIQKLVTAAKDFERTAKTLRDNLAYQRADATADEYCKKHPKADWASIHKDAHAKVKYDIEIGTLESKAVLAAELYLATLQLPKAEPKTLLGSSEV